ncbi:MAG: hypothetical protein QM725_09630 [Lacibacter sp.]
MNLFFLQFKETPKLENLDYSLIEYDPTQNLSVNKITRQPAIDSLKLDTETFTKSQGENSDSDNNNQIAILLDTETRTFTRTEVSDSDV